MAPLVRWLAILTAALLCHAPAQARVDIALWTLLNGGDGARMRALVEGFNASQQEVRVVSTTLKWGEPFYTKLITASAVGAGPDVATIHLSRIANLAAGGVLRPIAASELERAGLRADDFYPRQRDQARYEGAMYAVPLDLHMLVLYYNKTLTGQAGLLDAEGRLQPIEGIDALTQAFARVRERTGARGMTMESAQSSYAVWRLWLSMLAQQHVPVITGDRFTFGRAGVDALATIADWFEQGYASRGLDYAASTSQFVGGKAGFMLNGVWEVPTLEAAVQGRTLGFDYGIVPLPRMFGDSSAWADSHGFAIPANGKRPPSPEKVQAVLQFVAYASRHAATWAEGGHVPAYRPVAESPAVRGLMPNALYAQATQNVIYDPPGWYAGAAGPMQFIASKFLPAALSGQLAPAEALDRFQSEAARLLVKPAPRY